MFPFQATTLGIVEDALFLCDEFRISYWDAAIVQQRDTLNCKTLYTRI